MNKDEINSTPVTWINDSGQAKAVQEQIALHRRCTRFGLGTEKIKLGKTSSDVELQRGQVKHLPVACEL